MRLVALGNTQPPLPSRASNSLPSASMRYPTIMSCDDSHPGGSGSSFACTKCYASNNCSQELDMKFAVSLSMERFSPNDTMNDAVTHMLALARIADEGGFETLWTAEHHTIECTISPNPFVTLTWLAQHTENIRLGTATLVAPYWSPIRLAGEAALCDHLTDGRLEFGIARGAYQYEFDRMAGGIPQQQGVGYMKELVPAVMKLWQGDYEHDGHYWKFPLATSVPKPLQQPHPPIWVAARDPGTFDWAVANGASILST